MQIKHLQLFFLAFGILQMQGCGGDDSEDDESDTEEATPSPPTTHIIDPWDFGMDNALPLVVKVGDVISFTWSTGTHNVQQLTDIDDCDSWTGPVLPMNNRAPFTSTYTFEASDAGKMIHFACEVNGHCLGEMKRSACVSGTADGWSNCARIEGFEDVEGVQAKMGHPVGEWASVRTSLATYLDIAESNIVKQEETGRRLDAHMEETTFICFAATLDSLEDKLTELAESADACETLGVASADACSVSGVEVVTVNIDTSTLDTGSSEDSEESEESEDSEESETPATPEPTAPATTTAGSTTASGSTTHAGTTASRRLAAHSRLTLVL